MYIEPLIILKIFIPTTVSFVIGILSAPFLVHLLYKHRAWKKAPGKFALDGSVASEFNKLHKAGEGKTPRMGGMLIWLSVLSAMLAMMVVSRFASPGSFLEGLNFFSRSQTLIPVATLVLGALFGVVNDYFDITTVRGGIRLRVRLLLIALLSFSIGTWFYAKVGVDAVALPYMGELVLGALIVPFFMLVSLMVYASGTIDGIDGLSGGVFGSIYTAYAILAFSQHQYDLAAFCGALAGAILAFLWFNIPPARFWMTETGTMPLTLTLAVVAIMTDTMGGGVGLAVLPIIGFLLLATVATTILQVLSKRFRGKKIFRVAPLHHHFEALGWPSYKVTMRYWVLSVITAILGLIVGVTGTI
jgi:phospho-N-acetylmuramoyl-pentapeptide-transferase